MLIKEEQGGQRPLFLGNVGPELPHTSLKRHLGNDQPRIQRSVRASKHILDPSRVHTDEAPGTKDQLVPRATDLSTNDWTHLMKTAKRCHKQTRARVSCRNYTLSFSRFGQCGLFPDSRSRMGTRAHVSVPHA